MGNFKKFMAMAAVSCMALTTMTACGNSGDAGSGDGDTNEIKIGLNYELSGETANYGTPEYNGSMLAIKQANANKDTVRRRKACIRMYSVSASKTLIRELPWQSMQRIP